MSFARFSEEMRAEARTITAMPWEVGQSDAVDRLKSQAEEGMRALVKLWYVTYGTDDEVHLDSGFEVMVRAAEQTLGLSVGVRSKEEYDDVLLRWAKTVGLRPVEEAVASSKTVVRKGDLDAALP